MTIVHEHDDFGCRQKICDRPEADTLDSLTRDFTTVHPKSKAEVRRRLMAYRKSVIEACVVELRHLKGPNPRLFEDCWHNGRGDALRTLNSLKEKEI